MLPEDIYFRTWLAQTTQPYLYAYQGATNSDIGVVEMRIRVGYLRELAGNSPVPTEPVEVIVEIVIPGGGNLNIRQSASPTATVIGKIASGKAVVVKEWLPTDKYAQLIEQPLAPNGGFIAVQYIKRIA